MNKKFKHEKISLWCFNLPIKRKKAIPYYNYHPVEENIYDHVQADESIYDDIINVTRKVGVNVSTFPYQTIF